MKTIISQGDKIPTEWDVTSSPTTVYHNYDVQKVVENEEILYQYTTDKMSRQEYNVYVTSRIEALETQNADLAEALLQLQYEKETEKLGGNL